MKSVLLKNIDVDLLREQKGLLVEHRALLRESKNIGEDGEAVDINTDHALSGIIHLLDAITDAVDAGLALDNSEVDFVTNNLSNLLSHLVVSDFSSLKEDVAMRTALAAFKGESYL